MPRPATRPAPSGYPDALLDDCIAAFQPRCPHELTREDAREILHNITGVYRILVAWKRRRAAQGEGRLPGAGACDE